MIPDNPTILVTGGTGSFGHQFVRSALEELNPRKLIVFSRDELKQHEMRREFPDGMGSPMRYFIGDVRDGERLQRAFRGVDVIIHAAALKQVPACEYNPFEAIQTNVMGAKNIIDAAIDQRVQTVLALSTDKAVNPANLYGATKLCSEKLFVQGNYYAGEKQTSFSCVRYGNVVGSRGSVIPVFRSQRSSGTITITDPRMTRFWITLPQGVRFVIDCLRCMKGGEIFIPKIPSMNIMDLAAVVAPECEIKYSGIRSGEKLHEALLSEDEARHTRELETMFVIEPNFGWWESNDSDGSRPPEGFRYSSETNPEILDRPGLARYLESL